MPFSLSPSVEITETDLTTSIMATSTSVGALSGDFEWGPCNEAVLIDGEENLIRYFGYPNNQNYKTWYTASNFLSYSNSLNVVRAIGPLSCNASNVDSGELIQNSTDFSLNSGTLLNPVYAKYPGSYGNRISIAGISNDYTVAISGAFPVDTIFGDAMAIGDIIDVYGKYYQLAAIATIASGTPTEVAAWVASQTAVFIPVINPVEQYFDNLPEADQIQLVVFIDGKYSESFTLSTVEGNTDSLTGRNNYIIEMITRESKYLYIKSAAAFETLFSPLGILSNTTLVGGVDSIPGASDLISEGKGYFIFSDSDTIDINLVMAGGTTQVVQEWIIENIANARKDCVAFISPPSSIVGADMNTIKESIISHRNEFNATTYAVMDANYKYQYDRYNDVYRWVPLNGDLAGLCALTDSTNDTWWSPAGYNRGRIKNVVKLAWNPSKAYRDLLYKSGVNPVINIPGEGVLLYGDKTMTNKPSAFGFINVRRLFIFLEKAIATSAKYSMFEFNDAFTRNRFTGMVVPFLRDVKGRRGVYDYYVVCDESNNTGEVIDRGEFKADIYIKPSRSIQSIYLNFVAVKTGVQFEEVIGSN